MGMAGTLHETVYTARGLEFWAEYYADLDYDDDGGLIITRKHVAYDPAVTAEKVARVVREGVAVSANGQGDPDAGRHGVRAFGHAGRGGTGGGSGGGARWRGLRLLTPVPGTFYRRPDPDSDPFFSDGDTVSAGDVIGLVEIMKNFQDVEAEVGRHARRVPGGQRGRRPGRAGRRGDRRRVVKVLVANRGEIAVRIIRACRDLGFESVAVYTDADAGAPHVRLADEAVSLGAPKAYLDGEAVLDGGARAATRCTPATASTPSRASFARACEEAGLRLIGPKPEHIELMGDKAAARAAAADAGVPVVPGSDGAVADVEAAVAAAVEYPVAVKAAAGGGGRGIRIASDEASLRKAFTAAAREAGGAFGDDRRVRRALRRARAAHRGPGLRRRGARASASARCSGAARRSSRRRRRRPTTRRRCARRRRRWRARSATAGRGRSSSWSTTRPATSSSSR